MHHDANLTLTQMTEIINRADQILRYYVLTNEQADEVRAKLLEYLRSNNDAGMYPYGE
jgi:ATP-dependent Clp protease ATP-binding subunit ClpA